MGCPARLMDAADRTIDLPNAYPVPRLRPRSLPHLGLTCHASWIAPDGVWVFRTADLWPEDPQPTVTLITADEREQQVAPEDLPATAILWTIRDPQGRVVYRDV